MSSQLTIRTLARSSGLWARPVSTTSIRYADNDDKSMYDKVKDKAGEHTCASMYLSICQVVPVKQNRHLHEDAAMPALAAWQQAYSFLDKCKLRERSKTCVAPLYCNANA